MMISTKDQILERLNTRFQAKPDHMWQPLSQFLLDLLGLKVTTPVIIPEEPQQTLQILQRHARIYSYITQVCET